MVLGADALYQNIDIIESYGPDHILGGDHVYKMDYEPCSAALRAAGRRDGGLYRGPREEAGTSA